MKLSVVMLSTSLGMGGADQQILYLSRALLNKGHKVWIVSMTPLGPMGLEAQAQGLEIYDLHMLRKVPDPRALLRLAILLRQWRPQILHSHMFHANLLARLVKFLTPVPVSISTIQNIKEGGHWRDIVYRLTDALCDLTTNVSQLGVEKYVQLGAVPKQKIRLTPNSIDTNQFRFSLDVRKKLRCESELEEKFVWLAVGRFHKQKDYPNMLRAFAQVSNQYPNALLLIAGQGLQSSEAKNLARVLEIETRVRFLGVRRDVAELMNAADGYLMSSAWEGMPLVLLEASAMSLPIVATNVGGIREVVLDKESGFLVSPGNPIALAQAMGCLMELPQDERRRMGEFGRQHVECNYSNERIVDMWEKQYMEMLFEKLNVKNLDRCSAEFQNAARKIKL